MEGWRTAADQGAQSRPERTEIIAQGDPRMNAQQSMQDAFKSLATALDAQMTEQSQSLTSAQRRIDALERRCNELESTVAAFGGEHMAVISAFFGALGATPTFTELHRAIRRSLQHTKSGVLLPGTNPSFRDAFSYASQMIDAGIDRGIEMAASDNTN
jgi:hypothetical protein